MTGRTSYVPARAQRSIRRVPSVVNVINGLQQQTTRIPGLEGRTLPSRPKCSTFHFFLTHSFLLLEIAGASMTLESSRGMQRGVGEQEKYSCRKKSILDLGGNLGSTANFGPFLRMRPFCIWTIYGQMQCIMS